MLCLDKYFCTKYQEFLGQILIGFLSYCQRTKVFKPHLSNQVSELRNYAFMHVRADCLWNSDIITTPKVSFMVDCKTVTFIVCIAICYQTSLSLTKSLSRSVVGFVCHAVTCIFWQDRGQVISLHDQTYKFSFVGVTGA